MHHRPLAELDELQSVESYEFERWDAVRDGPKTLEQARVALHARIDDPTAPDDESVRWAYAERV